MKTILFATLVSVTTGALAYTTYTVPVSDELAPYAKFVLNNSRVEQDAAGVVVSYDLPPELVGPNHPTIVLGGKKRPGNIMLLEGEFGEASCFNRADKVECIVEYDDLEIDMRGVEQVLRARSNDPLEIERRLQVARIFGGEPVGIVEINRATLP